MNNYVRQRCAIKRFDALLPRALMLLLLLWQAPLVVAVEDFEPPNIQLNDISLVAMNFDELRIALDLEVYNVNAKDIIVEEIRYQLLLNHTEVKRGLIQQREHFPKFTRRVVRVPVSLAYDKNISLILSALNGTKSPFYEIIGTVKLKGQRVPLPFFHKGKLALPRSVNHSEKSSVSFSAFTQLLAKIGDKT